MIFNKIKKLFLLLCACTGMISLQGSQKESSTGSQLESQTWKESPDGTCTWSDGAECFQDLKEPKESTESKTDTISLSSSMQEEKGQEVAAQYESASEVTQAPQAQALSSSSSSKRRSSDYSVPYGVDMSDIYQSIYPVPTTKPKQVIINPTALGQSLLPISITEKNGDYQILQTLRNGSQQIIHKNGSTFVQEKATGRNIVIFDGDNYLVSLDETLLVCRNKNKIQVINLLTDQKIIDYDYQYNCKFEFSPNGQWLIVYDNNRNFIFDLTHPDIPLKLEDDEIFYPELAVSFESGSVAFIKNGSLSVYDLQTKELRFQAQSFKFPVSFSPNGLFMMCSNDRDQVKIVDAVTGEQIMLAPHNYPYHTPFWISDDLFCCYADINHDIYEISSRSKIISSVSTLSPAIYDISYCPAKITSNKQYIILHDSRSKIVDVQELRSKLRGIFFEISDDDRYLVARDGAVKFTLLDRIEQKKYMFNIIGTDLSFGFSEDNSLLFIAKADRKSRGYYDDQEYWYTAPGGLTIDIIDLKTKKILYSISDIENKHCIDDSKLTITSSKNSPIINLSYRKFQPTWFGSSPSKYISVDCHYDLNPAGIHQITDGHMNMRQMALLQCLHAGNDKIEQEIPIQALETILDSFPKKIKKSLLHKYHIAEEKKKNMYMKYIKKYAPIIVPSLIAVGTLAWLYKNKKTQ